MLPGYGFDPRPIMPNRSALARLPLFAANFTCLLAATCLPLVLVLPNENRLANQQKLLVRLNQTPVKLGITKLRKDEKIPVAFVVG